MNTTTESGFILEEMDNQWASFDKAAINICAQIMKNASKNKGLAVALRINWVNTGLIEPDATYQEVACNPILMKTLLKWLGNALPVKPEDSHYGMGHLSDHKMYFNCGSDSLLNTVIAPLNLSYKDAERLKKNRLNLFSFVRNTRNTILDNMDLVGNFILFSFQFFNNFVSL